MSGCISLFDTSQNKLLTMKQDSSASSRASVSADNVLSTTLFNFLDFHAIGKNFSLPHKNITKPPWDAPLLRFATEAPLKHVMYKQTFKVS